MRIACAEPESDASARLPEHNVLGSDGPLAGQRPVVDGKRLRKLIGAALAERPASRRREVLAAPIAQIRLGCPQVGPVGWRLGPNRLDADWVAVDTEQPLESAL